MTMVLRNARHRSLVSWANAECDNIGRVRISEWIVHCDVRTTKMCVCARTGKCVVYRFRKFGMSRCQLPHSVTRSQPFGLFQLNRLLRPERRLWKIRICLHFQNLFGDWPSFHSNVYCRSSQSGPRSRTARESGKTLDGNEHVQILHVDGWGFCNTVIVLLLFRRDVHLPHHVHRVAWIHNNLSSAPIPDREVAPDPNLSSNVPLFPWHVTRTSKKVCGTCPRRPSCMFFTPVSPTWTPALNTWRHCLRSFLVAPWTSPKDGPFRSLIWIECFGVSAESDHQIVSGRHSHLRFFKVDFLRRVWIAAERRFPCVWSSASQTRCRVTRGFWQLHWDCPSCLDDPVFLLQFCLQVLHICSDATCLYPSRSHIFNSRVLKIFWRGMRWLRFLSQLSSFLSRSLLLCESEPLINRLDSRTDLDIRTSAFNLAISLSCLFVRPSHSTSRYWDSKISEVNYLSRSCRRRTQSTIEDLSSW